MQNSRRASQLSLRHHSAPPTTRSVLVHIQSKTMSHGTYIQGPVKPTFRHSSALEALRRHPQRVQANRAVVQACHCKH